MVDIRLAHPAQTLPGFPLAGGRKWDRGISRDGISENCNGQMVEKVECPLFSPTL